MAGEWLSLLKAVVSKHLGEANALNLVLETDIESSDTASETDMRVYEANVPDGLLKPFSDERVEATLTCVKTRLLPKLTSGRYRP
jgi:hypothetical protein